MYVAIKHQIKNPAEFQERGKAVLKPENLPAGIKPIQFLPKPDLSTAVCLYEGPSVDAVRDYIDGHIGDAAQNEFFEVSEQHSVGLPK